jgi:hypothetical protein
MYLYMYIVFVLYLTCFITWSIDFIVIQSISSGLYDLYLDLLDFEMNELAKHRDNITLYTQYVSLIIWHYLTHSYNKFHCRSVASKLTNNIPSNESTSY